MLPLPTYPSSTQFDIIGLAIVKFLKLPPTKNNISIWKDALQTKLKRKRTENLENVIVQNYRLKYSYAGSGRPVKRRFNELAKRDRHIQMLILPNNDEKPDEIEAKANQLRNMSPTDVLTQLKLWKETLHFRRQSIKDHSTEDIINDFPGYSNSLLIFEEVKLLTKIDLPTAVRRQIPELLNKMLSVPLFITESPPIRLIKILCKEFREPVQHLFCNDEPSSPYPMLVCINNAIHIYVDFISILSTTYVDDAFALLIAMYTIFGLTFDRKSRVVRLLYSVLHGETKYLTNSVRIFIKEKNIDIYAEQQHQLKQHQSVLNSSSNDSTELIDESQPQSQLQIISPSASSTKINSLATDQSTETQSTNDNPDSILNTSFDMNENNNNHIQISSPPSPPLSNMSSQKQIQPRKGRKRNLSINNKKSLHLTTDETNDHSLKTANSVPLEDLTKSISTSQPKRTKRL
ncbi:unnamed protein product [Adineta steineri]|uniref:Uncharacterized protein n=1 Tax=Adineta steineri TaxID=433720 RepID=A0A814MDT9_9BILA|nr:unnamed protein product [Adineta steineri]